MFAPIPRIKYDSRWLCSLRSASVRLIQQKSYFSANVSAPIAHRGSRVHHDSPAIRPFTLMLDHPMKFISALVITVGMLAISGCSVNRSPGSSVSSDNIVESHSLFDDYSVFYLMKMNRYILIERGNDLTFSLNGSGKVSFSLGAAMESKATVNVERGVIVVKLKGVEIYNSESDHDSLIVCVTKNGLTKH